MRLANSRTQSDFILQAEQKSFKLRAFQRILKLQVPKNANYCFRHDSGNFRYCTRIRNSKCFGWYACGSRKISDETIHPFKTFATPSNSAKSEHLRDRSPYMYTFSAPWRDRNG